MIPRSIVLSALALLVAGTQSMPDSAEAKGRGAADIFVKATTFTMSRPDENRARPSADLVARR